MIGVMRRHEIQVLREAGHKITEIAAKVGCSEKTVRRVLKEEHVVNGDETAFRKKRRVGRPSVLEPVRDFVAALLKDEATAELPTLEILRRAREKGYTGKKSSLYSLVRSLRSVSAKPIVRFEGLAGEFSQHDFGEVVVEYVSGEKERIRFFASRLKYSRFAHVELVNDQRVESLVRGTIRAFEVFGGVPLVAVFDNPKTVVLSRHGREIEWNQTFGQAVLDLRVAPELCYPRRANQKGSVENLVGWVKGSFFKVRRFEDREDLARQLAEWLKETNETRPSRATGIIPAVRLVEDRARLRPLPFTAEQYALRFPVVVGPTAFVEHDGVRYAMPPRSIGVPGTLYLYPEKVKIVAGRFDRVHPRFPEQGNTVSTAEDRAALIAAVSGERAQLYFKRQQLLQLGDTAELFLTELVHRRKRTWKGDVEQLYDLFASAGSVRLIEAMRVACEQNLIGAEWVAQILESFAA